MTWVRRTVNKRNIATVIIQKEDAATREGSGSRSRGELGLSCRCACGGRAFEWNSGVLYSALVVAEVRVLVGWRRAAVGGLGMCEFAKNVWPGGYASGNPSVGCEFCHVVSWVLEGGVNGVRCALSVVVRVGEGPVEFGSPGWSVYCAVRGKDGVGSGRSLLREWLDSALHIRLLSSIRDFCTSAGRAQICSSFPGECWKERAVEAKIGDIDDGESRDRYSYLGRVSQ